jgi:hypothetical protein
MEKIYVGILWWAINSSLIHLPGQFLDAHVTHYDLTNNN